MVLLNGLKRWSRRLRGSVQSRPSSSESASDSHGRAKTDSLKSFEGVKVLGVKKVLNEGQLLKTVNFLRRKRKPLKTEFDVTVTPTNIQLIQQNPQKLLYNHTVGELKNFCILKRKPRIFGYVVKDSESEGYLCICLKTPKNSGIEGEALKTAFESACVQWDSLKTQEHPRVQQLKVTSQIEKSVTSSVSVYEDIDTPLSPGEVQRLKNGSLGEVPTSRSEVSITPSDVSEEDASDQLPTENDISLLAWELVQKSWKDADCFQVERQYLQASARTENTLKDKRERLQIARDVVWNEVEKALSEISDALEISETDSMNGYDLYSPLSQSVNSMDLQQSHSGQTNRHLPNHHQTSTTD